VGKKVLVTGGAGFIGSHIVDALVDAGHEVTILDNLDPQVHTTGEPPEHINPDARFVRGDVRDGALVEELMRDVQVLSHQAAAVGVGQSMYRIREYVDANSVGAASILAAARRSPSLERMIVASSMSVYGEGAYLCPEHGAVSPGLRSREQLLARQWELRCPQCGAELTPRPTGESKPLGPTSVYAVTKRDHEELFVAVGQAYEIPTVALRYFNVYGARQSLSNPYTGVAAIFSSRLLNGQPPLVFEDGRQSRDFVHVSDIVRANLLSMDAPADVDRVFNIGTGRPLSLLDLVDALNSVFRGTEPEFLGKSRAGDIRHCYADTRRAREQLGFEPAVRFEDGVADLCEWARRQVAHDSVMQAKRELEEAGLTL
jgi:dTDP-L-rhamnose 4-epimerase